MTKSKNSSQLHQTFQQKKGLIIGSHTAIKMTQTRLFQYQKIIYEHTNRKVHKTKI